MSNSSTWSLPRIVHRCSDGLKQFGFLKRPSDDADCGSQVPIRHTTEAHCIQFSEPASEISEVSHYWSERRVNRDSRSTRRRVARGASRSFNFFFLNLYLKKNCRRQRDVVKMPSWPLGPVTPQGDRMGRSLTIVKFPRWPVWPVSSGKSHFFAFLIYVFL